MFSIMEVDDECIGVLTGIMVQVLKMYHNKLSQLVVF